MKNDKGIAGLTIILSIVVMLFIIGLLVMIFVIMGAQMMDTDAVWSRSGEIAVANETLSSVETPGVNLSVVNYRSVVCTISAVYNGTVHTPILAANYTQTNCHLTNSTSGDDTGFTGEDWTVTYTYNSLYDSGGISAVNDTMTSIDDVITWFPLYIVIGSMVVLILLTVIIITAIRSSGIMGGTQGNTRPPKVGTA